LDKTLRLVAGVACLGNGGKFFEQRGLSGREIRDAQRKSQSAEERKLRSRNEASSQAFDPGQLKQQIC
jgi:hypothetical protein